MRILQNTWEALFSEKLSYMFYTRVREELIEHIWNTGNGKDKEMLAQEVMKMYVNCKIAEKLDIFTDTDGQQYHQYLFPRFRGVTTNFTRRVPVAASEQDGKDYDTLVKRYEEPTEFLSVLTTVAMLGTEEEERVWDGDQWHVTDHPYLMM